MTGQITYTLTESHNAKKIIATPRIWVKLLQHSNFIANSNKSRNLGCQHGTARIYCWAPCYCPVLLGARRPPLSIGISCPHGAHQQTRRTLLLRSKDRTDGRTNGRTDTRPLHRPCSVYYWPTSELTACYLESTFFAFVVWCVWIGTVICLCWTIFPENIELKITTAFPRPTVSQAVWRSVHIPRRENRPCMFIQYICTEYGTSAGSVFCLTYYTVLEKSNYAYYFYFLITQSKWANIRNFW